MNLSRDIQPTSTPFDQNHACRVLRSRYKHEISKFEKIDVKLLSDKSNEIIFVSAVYVRFIV